MKGRTAMHQKVAISLALVVGALPACSSKDSEAKERLFSPAPPDPMVAQAKEEIPAFELATNEDAWVRVNRMPFDELRRRLGAFTYASSGTLDFQRQKLQIRSTERVKITQAEGDDFSISLTTGDGSAQEIVYANDVLFLKNNNGNWRASRDPKGERTELIDDSAGVWRSFFDLFRHALTIEKKSGLGNRKGRETVTYAIKVKDESAKAAAAGAEEGALPTEEPFARDDEETDGGAVAREKLPQHVVNDRMARWRQNAHPAGGEGEIVVDTKTGVVLAVRFKGALAIGDAPTPGRLDVEIATDIADVGADLVVAAPKDAIEEITRKKWPTDPRADLEKQGIVPPLPKEEKPAADAPTDAPSSTAGTTE